MRAPANPATQVLRALLATCKHVLNSSNIQQTWQLPGLLPPILQQQPVRGVSQVCRGLIQNPQKYQQQLTGSSHVWRQQQLHCRHRLMQQWPTAVIQRQGMATRVEQQQAANPGLRFWKPTSPGQRGRVTVRRTGIWKGRPLRCLTLGTTRIGGRNAYGRITVRHKGGGAKRKLRFVDCIRKSAAEGIVERLEYDPNRTGYIALVRYPAADNKQPIYSYVLAPQDLNPGDTISAGPGVPVKHGNTMPLRDIPVGMPINSIELVPGAGGILCRAAGCMATIVNKQKEHAIVRLPSGEQRLIYMRCNATIGAVSNPQNKNRVLAKAGASRQLGRRPKVRGVAMNPVDHPHGGGTAGGRPSCSPWGLHAKGKKTRNKRKPSGRWILSPRPRKSAMG